MTRTQAEPRASILVGIDARLRAYRGGGIAEHVNRLLAGLTAIDAEHDGVRMRVFAHRKERGADASRRAVGAYRAGSATETAERSIAGSTAGSTHGKADGARDGVAGTVDAAGSVDAAGPAPDVEREHRGARKDARHDARHHRPHHGRHETTYLWTPPHHRLEGLSLPLEIAVRGRLDLLHSPDVVVPAAWRGPSVATVHDVAFLRRPELLTDESRRYYTQVHRSVRRATRIITVSEHTRRELLALTDVDPAKIVVVPNAVAPHLLDGGEIAGSGNSVDCDGHGRLGPVLGVHEVDEPDVLGRRAMDRDVHGRGNLLGDRDERAIAGARSSPALPPTTDHAPYVLFVSTIEPRKNVRVLLEAFRAWIDAGGAQHEGRDVQLVLAGGDGWKSEEVYARANALRLGHRVHWPGWVGAAELAGLYRGALMLAHPALDEGFGMTPLEAMACGTPVVVSDAGSLPEVVGDAGLLVDPTNVAAWKAALERVTGDPNLRRAMRESGPPRAAQFTIQRQARETIAVYRAAVEQADAQ